MPAHHFFAIAVQTLVPFLGELLAPPGAAFQIRERANLDRRIPQHIQIVDFAQEILQVFQVSAPGGVFAREKVFHRIAQALDADAQFVEGGLGTGAQGALVEVVRRYPFFER